MQEFVKKHKTPLSLLTNFLLVMIVWMTVSKVTLFSSGQGLGVIVWTAVVKTLQTLTRPRGLHTCSVFSHF